MSSHAFGICTTATRTSLSLPMTNIVAAWDARVGVTNDAGVGRIIFVKWKTTTIGE